MKSSIPSRSAAIKHRRGYALIVVLSVIVLCVVMVTAFLSRSMQERSAAAGNKATADARRLGDIAVSMVQGLINHATTQGSDVAWVSQPGMVRTFKSTGELKNAYKLFSASRVVSEGVSLTDDLPPAMWVDSPAVWVDLNAPVTSGGIKHFPILAFSSKTTQDISDPSPDKPMPTSSGNVLPVEGFSLGAVPGSTSYQPIPMPLRWLYILQDGQLVAPPDDASGKTVTIAEATASNPIVGRIAFWTDDETTKININTAGEPTFWDTPRGTSQQDFWGFAVRQPANGEYQRYPGHPAMVALSSAFPFETLTDDPLPPSPSTTPTNYRHVDDYLKLTPRYTFAGSKAGTVSYEVLRADTSGMLIQAKDDERLYTSLDELLFRPTLTGGIRSTDSFVNRPLLDSRKFFLTAHSRAPETNLFNLPRIATWPVYRMSAPDWNSRTTAYDRAMVYCSSTGPSSGTQVPYIFQRELALDPDNDYTNIPRNQQLYQYLQYLTSRPIPGVKNGGSTFSSKYPQDRDQILTQIMDYIRCTNLADGNLVNADGTPNGAMMYARYDSHASGSIAGAGCVAPLHGPNNTMGQGRFQTLKQLSAVFFSCGDPGVAASNVTANKMLNEPFPSGPATLLNTGERRIQMFMLPEIIMTMAGFRTAVPILTVEILGLDQFKINGVPLQMPSTAYTVFYNPTMALAGNDQGPDYPQAMACHYKVKTLHSSFPVNNVSAFGPYGPGGTVLYPFVSAPVTVNTSTGLMSFTGGSLTVNLYAGETMKTTAIPDVRGSTAPPYDGSKRKLVQTFKMTFPSGTFPIPTTSSSESQFWSFFSDGSGVSFNKPAAPSTPAARGRCYLCFTGSQGSSAGLIDINNDVVRSMVPKLSDYRVISTLRDDADMFVPHRQYNDTAVTKAFFYTTNNTASQNTFNGNIVSKQTGLGTDNIPKDSAQIPAGTGFSINPAEATGDFDTGAGSTRNGSLANKPDDGDLGETWTPYYQSGRDGDLLNSFFSPNRLTPGAGMFGSLSTCARSPLTQWRTLLFRPVASDYETTHYGLTSPKDHYLLDLFWMPVVTPWAISDRFSTAGKINMNYQIMPFTYIKRATAMHAVLKGERAPRLPNNTVGGLSLFSGNYNSYVPVARNDRKVIDPDLTLQQFQDRFNQTDTTHNVFLSPSEICDITLVPRGETLASAKTWANFRTTGDNVREKPYATMLNKLTTKSNTFLVHFRTQSLKKAIGTDPAVWTEGRDAVTSEYRGSTSIERFVNPDTTIPDYPAIIAGSPGADLTESTLDTFYKWRVIANTQFAP